MLKITVACAVACALAVAAHALGDFRVDIEDAKLDVPDLIAKYGYPVEVHDVTTSDGYILQLHRIPRGRDNYSAPGPRPVIFLMHGLLSSSADYVIMGPGRALAYILAEEGFDVWLGNARGNYYSRRHRSLNPDFGTGFWNFSWDQIGHTDVATSVDFALANSGQDSLHYVGHSQGTTSFLVLCALRPSYNIKFKTVHLLAPVAFFSGLDNSLLFTLSSFSTALDRLALLLGINEMFPRGSTFEYVDGEVRCIQNGLFTGLCEQFIQGFSSQDQDQFAADMLPVILGHTPAGSSIKQFAHFGQTISSNRFRRWQYPSATQNLLAYGRLNPPEYDLSAVTANVKLHYSLGDTLTPEADVISLNDALPRSTVRQVPAPTFSHFDFAWGTSAREHVYDDVIASVRDHENNGF